MRSRQSHAMLERISMIQSERKRWLAARLRQIAHETPRALEWPAIAADFDKLADAIEHDLTASDDAPTSDKESR